MRDVDSRARRALVVTAFATASTVMAAVAAHATFTSTANAAQQLSTATLAPPTSPATFAGTCTAGQHDEVGITWTATGSAWAHGYEVLRATATDGPYTVVATLAGQPATTYVDTGLAFDTTYHYTVRATRYEWRSVGTTAVSRVTRTASCT